MHTQKAREKLYFWLIGFDPVYERDVVRHAIRAACEKHGASSVVVYELLGVYDLLLRVWLPADCEFEAFSKTLTDELMSAGLQMLDPFRVDYMIRHWPFFQDGEQQVPLDAALHHLRQSAIDQVEQGFEEAGDELIEELEDRKLLACTNGRNADDQANFGIKFMMTIRGGCQDLTPFEMEELKAG